MNNNFKIKTYLVKKANISQKYENKKKKKGKDNFLTNTLTSKSKTIISTTTYK